MDIFELNAYHFYKVIEILIRAEEGLSRDVVKHLNSVSVDLRSPFTDRDSALAVCGCFY